MNTILIQPKIGFYKNTYFVYNISMNVKTRLSPIERLRQIMKSRDGLLLTSDLATTGIPRTYLSILKQNGEVERVSRGVYRSTETFFEDEFFSFQSQHKSTIFSHETALFFHNLTDRTPLTYSITVPSGYHSQALNNSAHKVFYVKRDLFRLGIITTKTPHGNQVLATDLERTICDIVRSRSQIDIQIRSEALKRYTKSREKNMDILLKYAQQFSIQKIIREYLEILL